MMPPDDGQRSQMGESVLYRELQNHQQQETYMYNLWTFKAKLVTLTFTLVLLTVMTLIANHVGIVTQEDNVLDETLCAPIGLNWWYIIFTSIIGLKLIVTLIRYQMFKA
jgi:hypothetical protein